MIQFVTFSIGIEYLSPTNVCSQSFVLLFSDKSVVGTLLKRAEIDTQSKTDEIYLHEIQLYLHTKFYHKQQTEIRTYYRLCHYYNFFEQFYIEYYPEDAVSFTVKNSCNRNLINTRINSNTLKSVTIRLCRTFECFSAECYKLASL